MTDHFETVKNYLYELDFVIEQQNETDGILVVSHEDDGISKLVIGVVEPLLIFEQFLFNLPEDAKEVHKSLLMKNREVVHGTFALDETGTKVIYRDTLQVENLDMNELAGTLNALKLLLSEYAEEIIKLSK